MSNMDMRLVLDNPSISKKRSYIPYMKHKSQIDFNAGLLVPLDRAWEVLPGDTFKVKHSLNLRMTNPPKVPVMDQLVFDIFYFYTPLRILWNEFDTFITGDVGTAWNTVSTLIIPEYFIDGAYKKTFEQGSLLDYLGAPIGSASDNFHFAINPLPLRGYYKIWNWWFRYEPLQEELYVYEGSTAEYYTPGNSVSGAVIGDIYDSSHIDRYMEALRTNATKCGWLAPVNKLSDQFTRCLPQPMAGPDIPIMAFDNAMLGEPYYSGDSKPLRAFFDDPFDSNTQVGIDLVPTASKQYGSLIDHDSAFNMVGLSAPGVGITGVSNNTIRDLRQAFAIEQVFTIESRYSRRLPDWSIGMFGVNVPDYRVQQPEMLGHTRIFVNMNQVIQSSATDSTSPQGNVGSWSETRHSGYDFTKSFCEHGYIYCLGCVRVLNRTYSQGLNKMFTRKTRFDFYLPPLANISDQPLYSRELFCFDNASTTYIFGWQEAWYDYKYLANHVANHCRPNAANTIAIWNYAEYFASRPSFSEEFIIEPAYGLDRTMYLNSSTTVSQFILDMYFDISCYRTMPLHAIPGTLSHYW